LQQPLDWARARKLHRQRGAMIKRVLPGQQKRTHAGGVDEVDTSRVDLDEVSRMRGERDPARDVTFHPARSSSPSSTTTTFTVIANDGSLIDSPSDVVVLTRDDRYASTGDTCMSGAP
jgi:hypothetical protein